MPQSEPLSLTGVWDGQYSYPRGLAPVQFTAVILQTGAAFSGTTHEQPTQGPSAGKTLNATIDGEQLGSAVSFTKIYDPAHKTHGRPIRYEGALSADGNEIDGRWTILGALSGKFLMIRSGRQATAAKARKRTSVPAV